MKYWLLSMIGLIMLSCSQPKTRPNVLLIMTDQQTIHMMSAMGNKELHTPAMDQLASSGVMFYQSYCTSPVCAPARSSIISGLMPHQTGVEWNGDIMKDQVNNMGEVFRQAGYETIWAGKWHLPESYPQRVQSKQKQIKGFDLLPFRDPKIDNWMLGSETDPPLTNAVIQYLDEYDQQQPFLLAVSYHNPHDICFYARKEGWITKEDSLLNIRHYNFDYQLPDVVGTHPENYHDLPELPPNHYPTQAEPDFIRDKRLYHQEYGLETHLAYQEFSELEWRGYLNAYYRLTEMVDEEIGRLIEGLERNGLRENTMIVFTSDHGDGAAAHQWAAKLSLYEESSKVPFIVSYQNQIPSGVIDRHHLVSQIDILPTLCDYAGIELPEVTGKSIRTIIEDPTAPWRDYLVVELADYKPARSRKGRMLRTANFKYNIYTQGNHNQQFFDLTQDPGETNNLVGQPQYADEINRHRELLQEWVLETNDNFPIAEVIR